MPDLSLEYSQAQVCIIPNIVGSGLKIKLIEALVFSIEDNEFVVISLYSIV